MFDGTRWVSISPHGMTSLPPATGTTLGAVIVGSGVNVAPDGTISVTHFSGDYNDLINKPIVAAPVQSDWNSAGGDSYILNKPVALSQFSNDLKISDFPNDALYATVPQAASAAPIQSIAAGANVAISDDGHGNITIASTGTGSGPGGGIASVSGSAPIKVVDGTTAPVISLNVGAGLKVASGILTVDVVSIAGLATVATSGSYNDLSGKPTIPTISDASTTTKGIVQIADAASITAGTALRAVDAAGLKAVTDQQTKDFVNVSGDTMTGTLVIPDGTAAAPSLKFDDATGLFQPAADIWAVSTGGVERCRVSATGITIPNHYTAQTTAVYGFYSGINKSATNSATFQFLAGGDAASQFNGQVLLRSGGGSSPSIAGRSAKTTGIDFVSTKFDFYVGGIQTCTVAAGSLDVNGVITVSATSGSAGSYLPSVCFASDPNTGLGQVGGADTVSLITAGVERLLVHANGNVGIGITSPAIPSPGKVSLDVNGPIISRGGVAGHQTSGGVVDFAGDALRMRAYGATAGTGAIDFRIGGGGGLADAQGARLDASANFILGSHVSPTGSRVLMLVNGTAPSASVGNSVMLYSEDVSSSAELKVRDEAGNVTTLSPHNFRLIPDGPSEPMAWAYYSEREGHRINVDMLRLARLVERLTGEKLVYEAGP